MKMPLDVKTLSFKWKRKSELKKKKLLFLIHLIEWRLHNKFLQSDGVLKLNHSSIFHNTFVSTPEVTSGHLLNKYVTDRALFHAVAQPTEGPSNDQLPTAKEPILRIPASQPYEDITDADDDAVPTSMDLVDVTDDVIPITSDAWIRNVTKPCTWVLENATSERYNNDDEGCSSFRIQKSKMESERESKYDAKRIVWVSHVGRIASVHLESHDGKLKSPSFLPSSSPVILGGSLIDVIACAEITSIRRFPSSSHLPPVPDSSSGLTVDVNVVFWAVSSSSSYASSSPSSLPTCVDKGQQLCLLPLSLPLPLSSPLPSPTSKMNGDQERTFTDEGEVSDELKFQIQGLLRRHLTFIIDEAVQGNSKTRENIMRANNAQRNEGPSENEIQNGKIQVLSVSLPSFPPNAIRLIVVLDSKRILTRKISGQQSEGIKGQPTEELVGKASLSLDVFACEISYLTLIYGTKKSSFTYLNPIHNANLNVDAKPTWRLIAQLETEAERGKERSRKDDTVGGYNGHKHKEMASNDNDDDDDDDDDVSITVLKYNPAKEKKNDATEHQMTRNSSSALKYSYIAAAKGRQLFVWLFNFDDFNVTEVLEYERSKAKGCQYEVIKHLPLFRSKRLPDNSSTHLKKSLECLGSWNELCLCTTDAALDENIEWNKINSANINGNNGECVGNCDHKRANSGNNDRNHSVKHFEEKKDSNLTNHDLVTASSYHTLPHVVLLCLSSQGWVGCYYLGSHDDIIKRKASVNLDESKGITKTIPIDLNIESSVQSSSMALLQPVCVVRLPELVRRMPPNPSRTTKPLGFAGISLISAMMFFGYGAKFSQHSELSHVLAVNPSLLSHIAPHALSIVFSIQASLPLPSPSLPASSTANANPLVVAISVPLLHQGKAKTNESNEEWEGVSSDADDFASFLSLEPIWPKNCRVAFAPITFPTPPSPSATVLSFKNHRSFMTAIFACSNTPSSRPLRGEVHDCTNPPNQLWIWNSMDGGVRVVANLPYNSPSYPESQQLPWVDQNFYRKEKLVDSLTNKPPFFCLDLLSYTNGPISKSKSNYNSICDWIVILSNPLDLPSKPLSPLLPLASSLLLSSCPNASRPSLSYSMITNYIVSENLDKVMRELESRCCCCCCYLDGKQLVIIRR